jgi:hypothetical protein
MTRKRNWNLKGSDQLRKEMISGHVYNLSSCGCVGVEGIVE